MGVVDVDAEAEAEADAEVKAEVDTKAAAAAFLRFAAWLAAFFLCFLTKAERASSASHR